MKNMVWHEVTPETIPDETVIVAFTDGDGNSDIIMDAYYDRREKRWYTLDERIHDYWGLLCCKVTHWMPQPDFPEDTK